jgi:hypothetical protein
MNLPFSAIWSLLTASENKPYIKKVGCCIDPVLETILVVGLHTTFHTQKGMYFLKFIALMAVISGMS